MKYLALVLLLAGCAHAQQREEVPQVDLAKMVAEAMADKPVVYIEKAQDSKRVIRLCPTAEPGAYDDSALGEAVRVIHKNKAIIRDCANKQLRDIAKEFNLELKE